MKKIWKKSKKPMMAVLSSVLLVLAVVLLFGQTKAEPENPMDGKSKQASQTDLTSSRLAMDRSLLEGVENANIHAGDSENRTDGQGQQNKPEEVQENQDQSQDEDDSGDPENRESESGEHDLQPSGFHTAGERTGRRRRSGRNKRVTFSDRKEAGGEWNRQLRSRKRNKAGRRKRRSGIRRRNPESRLGRQREPGVAGRGVRAFYNVH